MTPPAADPEPPRAMGASAMDRASCAWAIPRGAVVLTADAVRLGTVGAVTTHVLVVEGAWPARRAYALRPQLVAAVTDGVVRLSETWTEVEARWRIRG